MLTLTFYWKCIRIWLHYIYLDFISLIKIMDALSNTSFDPSLLSAWANSSVTPFAMLQVVSAMLGINFRLLMIVLLGITVFFCIVFWKLFVKANYKGYEALISGHNGYSLIVMSGKQGRYFFLFLIPIIIMNAPVFLGTINTTVISTCSAIGMLLFLILYIDVTVSLMKRFEKGIWFAIGVILLPIVFYPILAFGKAKYK